MYMCVCICIYMYVYMYTYMYMCVCVYVLEMSKTITSDFFKIILFYFILEETPSVQAEACQLTLLSCHAA